MPSRGCGPAEPGSRVDLGSEYQALRDSEHRYHTLTTVAPVGIFRTDATGSTTYVNPRWCELSGLSADEAMQDDWLRAVHPDDRERVIQGWREAATRQLPSTTEYRLVRSDGGVSWVLGNAVPERDSEGRFVGYIGTITDVTARLEAEGTLESQKHVLEMIVTGVPLEETLTALLRFVEQRYPDLLGSILLIAPDGLHVRHIAAPSLPEAYVREIDGSPIGPRAGSCGTAAYRRQPVVVDDIASDPLWDDYRATALAHGLRACWSSPIFDGQGTVLGTFAIYFREPRRPHQQHERLIETANHLAALAIARHREESALRASESSLAAAQARARLGSWEMDLATMQGTWSAQMYRLFNWDPARGVPAYDMTLELMHPADRERVQQAEERATTTGDSITVEFRSNPEYGPMRWLRGRMDPVLDPAGTVVRLAGTTLDVTEIRTVEEALVASEARFRATFEQAAVGVAHVSPEGVFIRVNERLAEITGYTRDELVGRRIAELRVAEDLPSDLDRLGRLLSGAMSTYTVEHRYRRQDGTLVWVHVTTSLVRRADGEPDYFITVVEDVSSRRSLEAQLRQSQKMEAIGLLAGGVAHDFNNVLSVILGHADLSMTQLSERDPLRADLQSIVDAARRAADITRQLLAFARKETAVPVLLDVNRSIDALRRMLVRLVGEDIALETMLDHDVWPIRHDSTQFDQVVVNLVTNARDAIGGVGAITLETKNVTLDAAYQQEHPDVSPGEYVMVRVSDTGVGMDAATQEQIFEPFFTTKPRGVGTGLGLPVVLGITQQAGGHVTVESTLGAGSTFRVYFPRRYERLEHAVAAPRTKADLRGTETVLLVEDEPALLTLARRTLESYGYMVLPARGPGEALLLAETHPGPIGLLVTDVVMPNMNGRELHERLALTHPAMRVLFMSGYPANIVAGRGALPPEMSYLQKPFLPTALATRVRAALD